MVSKTPLSDVINNSDATGRVAKWGIELSAFEITYKRRDTIKSQALADFVADWTEMLDATPLPEPEYWVMHFDGSKLLNGSGGWCIATVTNWPQATLRSANPLRGYEQHGGV